MYNAKLSRIFIMGKLYIFLGRTGLTGQKGDTGPAGPPSPTAGGVVYTTWGRTTRPTTSGTQLFYAGRAAGSSYHESGSGADYLCLPDDLDYLRYTNGVQGCCAYLRIWFRMRRMGECPTFCSSWPQCPMCSVLCFNQGDSDDDTWKDCVPFLMDSWILWLPDGK